MASSSNGKAPSYHTLGFVDDRSCATLQRQNSELEGRVEGLVAAMAKQSTEAERSAGVAARAAARRETAAWNAATKAEAITQKAANAKRMCWARCTTFFALFVSLIAIGSLFFCMYSQAEEVPEAETVVAWLGLALVVVAFVIVAALVHKEGR